LLSWYHAYHFGDTENEDPEVSHCEAECSCYIRNSLANLADVSELQDDDQTIGDEDSSNNDCCENQQGAGVIFLFSYMHVCGLLLNNVSCYVSLSE
jgi:hypothetical protein